MHHRNDGLGDLPVHGRNKKKRLKKKKEHMFREIGLEGIWEVLIQYVPIFC